MKRTALIVFFSPKPTCWLSIAGSLPATGEERGDRMDLAPCGAAPIVPDDDRQRRINEQTQTITKLRT